LGLRSFAAITVTTQAVGFIFITPPGGTEVSIAGTKAAAVLLTIIMTESQEDAVILTVHITITVPPVRAEAGEAVKTLHGLAAQGELRIALCRVDLNPLSGVMKAARRCFRPLQQGS